MNGTDPRGEEGPGLMALGRHAIWLIAVVVVLAALVQVRIDVQDLRGRLAKSRKELESADILRDRLAVELDARRRAEAMEAAAIDLGLTEPLVIVDLPRPTLPVDTRVAEVR